MFYIDTLVLGIVVDLGKAAGNPPYFNGEMKD